MTLAPNRPPFHDHPFSIASAPTELPRLRLVIGEAGDCTNGFGRIEPGTRAAIDGPHGSFILPEGKGPVVMIAGGVGVAPCSVFWGRLPPRETQGPSTSSMQLVSPPSLAGLDRLRELQSRLDLSVQCVVDDAGGRVRLFGRPPLRQAMSRDCSVTLARKAKR